MNAKADKSIRKVFRQNILALAELHKASGDEVMAANPSSDLSTYYTEPEVRKMSKADFETGGAKNLNEFEAVLNALWSDESNPEYAQLAKKLAKLARSVRTSKVQSSELSQFVYVMY